MQDQLKITLVQNDTQWRAIAENLKELSKMITSLNEKTDLIILPEMFSTGFDMEPQLAAETMNGSAIQWMQKTAKENNTAIAGSLIIEEKGHYYNRFIFVHTTGAMVHYDKKHLFSLAGEDKIYTAGENRLIFEYKGWKIAPFVCYDLRFPVWSRNTEFYDLAIYTANWPKPRITGWDTLLKARAIENLCYVAGVNRIGIDANNYEYPGHSQVLDPLGETVGSISENKKETLTVSLSKKHIENTRQKFQFLNDRDTFEFS
ncbi:amidohydrolase [Flavicella sediminum]|uniref:amidohydrolase n=1 Tax=Flavicella sediminum TaxID=2585141 RepID=UPI0011247BAD|nr:amidohydrolase [Flavicella sediminum]